MKKLKTLPNKAKRRVKSALVTTTQSIVQQIDLWERALSQGTIEILFNPKY
jgi:hypothetical protein